MVKKFLKNGSALLISRQATILSAAVVVMVMIAASRFLGLARNRVLAHFFSVETLSLYFAAFRLPEVIFEVLVYGTLSSAFIPTFTAYLSRKESKQGWYVASVSLNIALLFFGFFAVLIFALAPLVYRIIAAGYTPSELGQIVSLTRVLILAQGFFVISYFLTGVLESMQRFLVPAIAPLFYNLGIIFGAIFLSSRFGIYGPALGAVAGAFIHFAIQLPVAFHLGFRFKKIIDFSHPGVRKIGRLAAPRIVELSFLQVGKSIELFLASLISTAAYTYLTFASSLQLLPISLFGTSIAKASLPTLANQATRKNLDQFKKTFLTSFNEILFLVVPCAVFLAVLRIPVVRLAYGASRFTWTSTVETGWTLSAYCLGIFAQALIFLLARGFYALHDTSTPVKVSIGSIFFNALLSFIFVLVLRWSIWSLALSFSLASIVQVLMLTVLLDRKVGGLSKEKLITPFLKIFSSALLAGGIIFFLLKVFDRSAWDKKLSFLGRFGLILPTSFEHFVLDTRYTINLIWLIVLVSLIGGSVYLILTWALRVEELKVFTRLVLKMRNFRNWRSSRPKISQKKEIITVETKEL